MSIAGTTAIPVIAPELNSLTDFTLEDEDGLDVVGEGVLDKDEVGTDRMEDAVEHQASQVLVSG